MATNEVVNGLFSRRRGLWLLLLGLLMFVVAAGVGIWHGAVVSLRVAGDSMAPTLNGDHYSITCDDCRIHFNAAAVPLTQTGNATCPNCGYGGIALGDQPLQRGDPVSVHRLVFRFRSARRWEVVACRDDEGVPAVKRVVGLPGERIRVHQGDLYVDDRIVRKSLDQFRRMAILVHDDRFRPVLIKPLPLRWACKQPNSGWHVLKQGYSYQGTATNRSPASEPDSRRELDWLEYQHWRCYAGHRERTEEAPVQDNYGYNQGVSRTPLATSDLLVACHVRNASGTLWFRLHDGFEWFRIEFAVEADLMSLDRDGHRIAQIRTGSRHRGHDGLWELGVFDQQCVVAIDREVVFHVAYDRGDLRRDPVSRPVAIGMRGGNATLKTLQVWRDIHYLSPSGLTSTWQPERALGEGEFLLLGDNCPLSVDGRHWQPVGCPMDRLIGPVFAN